MKATQQECEAKAAEINDDIFGSDRKRKLKLMETVKMQVDASAKFALEKALSMNGISAAERTAFVELLREQKDAINLLLVDASLRQKSAEMLKPIFGYKSAEFIGAFQDAFRKIQSEVKLDMQRGRSGAS